MKKILSSVFKYKDDTFLSVAIMSVFLQHFFIIVKKSGISSFLYASTFIIVLVWFILKIADLFIFNKKIAYASQVSLINKRKSFFILISIFFLCILSVLIDQLICSKSIRFDLEYYRKVLIFFEILIFIFLCYSGSFTSFPILLVKIISLLFSFSIILLFFSGKANTWAGFERWHLLTLNLHNPNTCGLLLCILSALLFYSLLTSRLYVVKITYIISLLFMIFFLILTECRNAMIGLFGFFLGMVIAKHVKKNTLTLSTIVVLVPILFVSIYLLYFGLKGSYSASLITSASSTGKSNSTRYSIWLSAINIVNFIPFVGSYFVSSNGTGQFQWHNTELDLLVGFGIIPLIITLSYFMYILLTTFKDLKKIEVCATYGFVFMIFFLGTFESFPFYSANDLCFLSFLFIPILYHSSKKIVVEEEKESRLKCDVLLVAENNGFVLNSLKEYLVWNNLSTLILLDKNYASMIVKSKTKNNLISKFLLTMKIFDYAKSVKSDAIDIIIDGTLICPKLLNLLFLFKKVSIITHISKDPFFNALKLKTADASHIKKLCECEFNLIKEGSKIVSLKSSFMTINI